MTKTFEIIVEQKLVHRFTVDARSGSEASVALAGMLAAIVPSSAVGRLTTVETDRKIRAPRIVDTAAPAVAADDSLFAEREADPDIR